MRLAQLLAWLVVVVAVCVALGGCQAAQPRVPVYYPALVAPAACGDCGACHEVQRDGKYLRLYYSPGGRVELKRREKA